MLNKIIAIGTTSSKFYYFLPHKHNHWEIVYYFEGSGKNKIGDREITFNSGDIICQPPFVEHSESSETGFKNFFMLTESLEGFDETVPVFHDNYNNDFLTIFKLIFSHFHLRQNNWEKIIASLGQTLVDLMISSNASRLKLNDGGYRNDYIEMGKRILIDNISNSEFDMDKMFSQIPLSKMYFMKLFKKETSFTPLEYLMSRRIDYAKNLLTQKNTTNLRIKEIASLCGFDNVYYFSRMIKKKTGISPSQYVQDKTKI